MVCPMADVIEVLLGWPGVVLVFLATIGIAALLGRGGGGGGSHERGSGGGLGGAENEAVAMENADGMAGGVFACPPRRSRAPGIHWQAVGAGRPHHMCSAAGHCHWASHVLSELEWRPSVCLDC